MVEVGPGDTAAFGDPLGGGELVGHVDVPRLRPDRRAVGAGVGTQAHPAHRLDAAGDAGVDRPSRDQPGDQVIGLLRAAALAVDGGRAHLLGQSGRQPGHPGDVVGLLPVLRDTAADDLFDKRSVDAGLVHQSPLGGAEQFGGVQPGQPSVALPDRAAGGLDDDRITHASQARTRFSSLTSEDAVMPFVSGRAMFYWN